MVDSCINCQVKLSPKIGLDYLGFIFMIAAGFILSFLTPYFQIPDEPNHFARAYQISEGIFISPVELRNDDKITAVTDSPKVFFQQKYTYNLFSGDKRYSPNDIVELISAPLNDNERTKIYIHNTGQYSPVVYFPQALAAYIVRCLGGTAGAIYYAMRLGAVIFAALCVFGAVRVLPEKGLLIFLLSMMPMYLAESASVSADAVTYGVCIFASAYLLSLRRSEEKLTHSQMMLLLVLAIIVGQSKQIYGAVLLLYFLIPYKKLGGMKKYILFGAAVLGICLASSLIWTYISTVRYGVASAMHKVSNPQEQMKFIADNPLKVLVIFIKSNILSAPYLAVSFIGKLGWLSFRMPLWFYPVYCILIIIAGVYGNLNLSFRDRMIMLAGGLLTLFAMDLFEYLTWTAPGALRVDGLQGRYFIPLAVMIFSIFSARPRIKHEKCIAMIFGSLSIIMTITQNCLYFYR